MGIGSLLRSAAPAIGGVLGGMVGGPAGAAIGAGLGSGVSSAKQAREERASAQQAQAFSERMSSTAYQRAVQDLRAAGLNPMLGFAHPASSPGGVKAGVPAYGEAAVQAVGGMASADASSAQAERTRAETMPQWRLWDKLNAEIRELNARGATEEQRGFLTEQEAKRVEAEARSAIVSADVAEAFGMKRALSEYQILLAEAAKMRTEGEIDETAFGKVLRYIERVVHTIGSAAGGFLGGMAAGALRRNRSSAQGLRPGAGPGARMEWHREGLIDRSTGQLFRGR